MDTIEQLFKTLNRELEEKKKQHEEDVVNSQQFQQELRFHSAFTMDFLNSIRLVSLYSTRGKEIYDEFLTIRAIDDLIQSVVAIHSLLVNGAHNIIRRELRYMLERSVKYLIVDQELMGKTLSQKTEYLQTSIPNSSIEVIDRMKTYFEPDIDAAFKAEITDYYYKTCGYVHPSRKQVEEQFKNYSQGFTIGFESAKSLASINKLIFRGYDMMLVSLLTGFGESMSGDLFIQVFDGNSSWKFHKGKYVAHFSRLFDYKVERKERNS